MYKESRLFLRVRCDVPLEIFKADKRIGQGTVVDMSLGGLQLRCDSETARQAAPNFRVTPGQPISVSLILRLPRLGSQTDVPLTLASRMVVMRRLSENLFLFGVEFESLTPENRDTLQTYIQESARHKN